MLQDQNEPQRPITAASGPVAGAGAAPGDSTVTLPHLDTSRLSAALPRLRVRFGRCSGRGALAALILATFAVVACAAAGPSILVPRSAQTFPNWEAGPLHALIKRFIEDPQTLGLAFSGVL